MKKLGRILILLMVVSCLCGLLPTNTASATPTYATVTTDKTTYANSEDVVFTISSNGTSNTLWVYRVDGQWQNYYQNAGTAYSLNFGWEGEYKALVVAWDGTGSCQSSVIYFTVGNSGSSGSSAPTYATIGCDKSVYKLGDLVHFSMTGDGETNTLWIYTPNGTSEYFQDAGTAYSYIPTQAGQYEALMETWNSAGSFCSEMIRFRVVDPNATVTTKATTTKATTTKATTTKATTTKATTTKATTTKATTTKATTTKPTTAPTTKATTTKLTTAPTTRATTRPATTKPAPTTQYNPCANGHKYQNGYCIYCLAQDVNYNPCAKGHTYVDGYCVYCLKQKPGWSPCANGHIYENGYCIHCQAQDPNPCTRGEHTFAGGICINCFTVDPSYQAPPCANGHSFSSTGVCYECGYVDPNREPLPTSPTISPTMLPQTVPTMAPNYNVDDTYPPMTNTYTIMPDVDYNDAPGHNNDNIFDNDDIFDSDDDDDDDDDRSSSRRKRRAASKKDDTMTIALAVAGIGVVIIAASVAIWFAFKKK